MLVGGETQGSTCIYCCVVINKTNVEHPESGVKKQTICLFFKPVKKKTLGSFKTYLFIILYKKHI